MTAKLRRIIALWAMILLPLGYAIGSEVYYARSISPHGISNVRDYFNRFGDPDRIHQVHRKGQSYYEFNNHFPPP